MSLDKLLAWPAAQRAAAAETAKQGAEDAAKKALEAKTGSENALQDAGAAPALDDTDWFEVVS